MKKNSSIVLVVLLLTGCIIGNILGTAFAKYLPILNYGESIGFGPAVLDLNIIKLTFGFDASLTVSGIIGIIIAIFVYKKL